MELKVKVEGKVTVRLIERGKVVKEMKAKNAISRFFALSLANAMRGTSASYLFYYPWKVQLFNSAGALITELTSPSISGMQATWTDTSEQAYTVASVKIIGANAYSELQNEIARATGLNVSKAAGQALQVVWSVSISGPLWQLALQIIQDCFVRGYSTRGSANRILLRDPNGNALASIALSADYPVSDTTANYAFCRVQGTYTPSAQQTVRYVDGAYYDGTTTTILWSYQLTSDVTLQVNTTYTFRSEIQFPFNYVP